MWWRQEQLDVLGDAVAAAASGSPTVLSVEGAPGAGKSSLLAELRHGADGCAVLRADAFAGEQLTPYGLFDQWGLARPAVGPETSPFQAAQLLRVAVDELAQRGPVLITVDDLQWADADSVDTLVWLLRRATGDRLLVAAATRPLRAPTLPAWRRLLLEPETIRLRLTGLELAEVSQLLAQAAPAASADLAARLQRHTGGNPLILKALLAEYDATELEALDELPAPEDLTVTVGGRLADLPAPAGDLVRAVAVLGSGWVAMNLAARLADPAVPAVPEPAVAVALDEGLLEQRPAAGVSQLRVVHPALRSAVHASIPPARRRELHLRAADLLGGAEALRHRFEAADTFDDVLADDLARSADELHERAAYRAAAVELGRSSARTSDPVRREQRWLDSLFEHLLARDLEVVSQASSDVGWAQDRARRALVTAGLSIVTRRWLAARHALDALTPEALAAADPRTRYRIVVLRLWCRVMTGTPPETQVDEVSRAVTDPARDDAVHGYLAIAAGQVAVATAEPTGDDWRRAQAVSARTVTATTDTIGLAWQGMLFSVSGRFDEAVDLLEDVTRRARDGLTSFGEGVFHAYLGYASWMSGDWTAAERALRLAGDARFGTEHPMVAATTPLIAVARGDTATALDDIRRARTVLVEAPFRPAVQVAAISAVLARRLDGTADERGNVLRELSRSFGPDLVELRRLESPVWLTHLGLAAVWADEHDLARQVADRLTVWRAATGWFAAAADWVEGLLAERSGDLLDARKRIAATTAGGRFESLPLHSALALDDLARIESALGHADAATAASTHAARRLQQLGLARAPAGGSPDPAPSVLAALSDRERDVVGLLVEGMSSAQIARELFVTRSTVTFHLSKVFAKTNTTNRYELVDLVRSERS